MPRTILPWRKAAQRVDERPLWEQDQYEELERRLTIAELQAEIIAWTNEKVKFEIEVARAGNHLVNLQMKLAREVKELGVTEAMLRAAGTATESPDTADLDTR